MPERKVLNYIPLVLLAALLFITGCEEDEVYTGLAPTRLEKRAAWSPDGSTIAYYRIFRHHEDTEGIWLVDADGTNDRYLSPGFQADWSPDGERLVIATLDWNIYLIDKDGSNFEWLVRDGESNSPTWSPDGEWIFFQRPFGGYYKAGSYLIELASRQQVRLDINSFADWAPTGQNLCFVYRFDGTLGIGSMDISTQKVHQIALVDEEKYGLITNPPPYWSPKGDKILFQINIETWVVDTSGENLKCLADSATYPNWSHDSKHIIYTPYEWDARLWIMDADGSNKRPLREE